ncbi:hypothetical protein VOLCADRAFT_87158 [Volvox carteri f. nagariensis]|uniref:Clathrin/coatomer adaptor adaptin-like N-terminal domain-containing protein n=1 Tax=Volvox carteri f. nagariensis TaxID=3068 RepID=D8TKB8_VOLCA|nr:uncharacterized protein VOLCADRAFT_87158 [Volvox carteri f. nagariensis]EFJ52222.1 hypothetical protein VOLCADRAFT_87158 [Volvox carteri f. nagariensis]|eukprot:XP_002946996.1 hypothetical protein VOLCADRAFT_87158 [Volvox carteri f. nagariensis]
MQSKLEKVVAGLKTGPRFLKELREFDNLVKAIGECKSKAEEDRVISQEVELLKQRLSDPKLDKSRGKEYMVRLMYCDILGHDTSFAYVKALQFASDSNIHTKKAAYLALTQFLDYNNNLVLLLVNTLLLDMKSDNYLIVCTALVAATRLIGPDLVNAVYPVVVERLRHPNEHVRKKAVMALHWFGQLDPRREGALAGVELEKHFRTMLCDKAQVAWEPGGTHGRGVAQDPSVMSAALCALHDCIKLDPRPYKNLIPSFTSILKQVSEHRLPKTYDYHRFPAPFIQIKLLKILAALGAGDRSAAENMAAVLHQTLRRANTSHTIGSAIIYECVRTITTIYPNPQLLAAAAESIATFLRSTSHNLRYVGIDALAGITALNPSAAAEHQVAVLDCLEDPDDTLKLKTLELLYKMTKANNIQAGHGAGTRWGLVIVDKMMGYLGSCTDEHIRKDIVRKVCDLAERYAPSPAWFVTTISEVFRLGGEHVDEADGNRLVRLIAEQDASLHTSAVEAYLQLLDGESAAATAAPVGGGGGGAVPPPKGARRKKLPESILLVICWVLGEFGHLARRPPLAVLSRLVGILTAHKAASDRLRGCLLTALAKLAAHTGGAAGPVGQALLQKQGSHHNADGGGAAEVAELVHKCLNSQSLELQQRAHELQALLGCSPAVLAAALPVDASCEDFSPQDLEQVATLPFLEGHVARALAAGAAPYLPPEARGARAADGASKGLRFEAYEPAPYAIPLAAASTSYAAASVHDTRSSSAATAAPAAGGGAGPAAPQSAPSFAEPQLMIKTTGGRKWGPAQYETADYGGTSTSSSHGAPAATAPAAVAGAALSKSGGTHHSRSGSAASLTSQAPSERERLAASLFGGGSGGSGTTVISKPAPAGQRQVNGGAAVATAAVGPPPPQQRNPMDLLLDLDVPTPPPPQRPAGTATAGPPGQGITPPQLGGDWMDSLLHAPAGPAPPASSSLAGLEPARGGVGSFLGPATVSNGAGAMMYGMMQPLAPPQQQPGGMPPVMGMSGGMGLNVGMVPPPGGIMSPAPGHGPGLGIGMVGGPGAYGAAMPLQPQPQGWQSQQQQPMSGVMGGGMGLAAAPAAARGPQPLPLQSQRQADPFGDLLG